MRFEYDIDGDLCMYPDNKNEFDIMNKVRKDIFGIGMFNNYEYHRKIGIKIAFSNETELIKIIEKMRDDKVERILQIRNENEWIRFTARVMLELWG